jgi:hypothetical protein
MRLSLVDRSKSSPQRIGEFIEILVISHLPIIVGAKSSGLQGKIWLHVNMKILSPHVNTSPCKCHEIPPQV